MEIFNKEAKEATREKEAESPKQHKKGNNQ